VTKSFLSEASAGTWMCPKHCPRGKRGFFLTKLHPFPASVASDCYRMTGPIISNTAQHQQRTARLILLSESSSGKPDGTSFPHDLPRWECNGVCSALASQVVRAPSARLGMNVNMIDAPPLRIPRRRMPLGRAHGQPQAHGLYQLPLCMP
jgi:hypothetical protein